jgi:hypothetical protein
MYHVFRYALRHSNHVRYTETRTCIMSSDFLFVIRITFDIENRGHFSRLQTFSSSFESHSIKRNKHRYISRKLFCPGGMTPSEWKRSVRPIRDIPVAAYCTPGANTTHRVPYRPPITVSPVSSRSVSLLFYTITLALKANCDHTSEWVHWACAYIGIAM